MNATDPTALLPAPVWQAINGRASSGEYASRPVSPEILHLLFDAARCAASSYNLQPWRFLVATSADKAAHQRMLDCFEPSNQRWATSAPVLFIAVAVETFEDNTTINRHAWYDVGMAVQALATAATALGLFIHQAAGMHHQRIIDEYGLPAWAKPIAGIALGYRAAPQPIDARVRRRPLSEVVFGESWGKPATFVG